MSAHDNPRARGRRRVALGARFWTLTRESCSSGFGFPTTDAGFFPGGPNVIVAAAPLPEPGTLVVFGLGFAGAVARRFRKG
jgi:hypothetical protein